ncbi:PHP domain-containing protein [Thermodesulfatator atlanticus]|uniref:PHP domain-containing protein n=1 Tax=Thermodesulfatator atlanticus TaxID=501497 RepID=UPI0003B70EE3|nr:PHP domain-containing protein [Thermodesulfatator atlanticus]
MEEKAEQEPKFLVDLHVHTDVSPCGHQSLEACLERLSKIGYHAVCITDHFSTQAREIFANLSFNGKVRIFFGMEYSAPEGDFLLFAEEELPNFPYGLSAREVLAEIKKLNGLAIWAHPFRWGNEPDESLLEEGLVHAIEVINGRTAPQDNAKAFGLAEIYGLPMVAGSDAHTTEELGIVANFVDRPVETISDLFDLIKKGALEPTILRASVKSIYTRFAIRDYK